MNDSAHSTASDVDLDKTIEMALRVWGYKQGEVVSLMIHLGDRLGLYRALRGAGPVTAEGLAERTGLHPRWLLEWLRCQAAAGLVGSQDGEVVEFSPEAAALLADEDTSVWFAAGAFHGAAATAQTVERLAESFRTGGGLSFDDFGPEVAGRVERTLGPWSRLALVPTILPALDGVTTRLEAGAGVADVGCGSGVTLLTLAAAFPRSQFDGYDPSGMRSSGPSGTAPANMQPTPGFTLRPPRTCLRGRCSIWSSASTACTTCRTPTGRRGRCADA